MEDPEKSGMSGNRELLYDTKNGSFTLHTVSYAKIKCKMEFHLYPFDEHECQFGLDLWKNSSYQVLINRCETFHILKEQVVYTYVICFK